MKDELLKGLSVEELEERAEFAAAAADDAAAQCLCSICTCEF
jgi:hypothetical protein